MTTQSYKIFSAFTCGRVNDCDNLKKQELLLLLSLVSLKGGELLITLQLIHPDLIK